MSQFWTFGGSPWTGD